MGRLICVSSLSSCSYIPSLGFPLTVIFRVDVYMCVRVVCVMVTRISLSFTRFVFFSFLPFAIHDTAPPSVCCVLATSGERWRMAGVRMSNILVANM